MNSGIRIFSALIGCLLSSATAAATAAEYEVIREIDYRFCLSQFKKYEQVKAGDQNAHESLASTPGGDPEILVVKSSKDTSGNLSVEALYAFHESSPEKVRLLCTQSRSTLSFSKIFLHRVEENLAAIVRKSDPENQRQQREKRQALAQKKREEQERLDSIDEERNKVHASKIKAQIEECWNLGLSGTWPVRIVVRNGNIVGTKWLSKINGRDGVITKARVEDKLQNLSVKCPRLPVEGPVVVYLGPTVPKD